MKNRLKELRKVRGLSQAELARLLGVTRQAVNGFESGKFTPSLEVAFKIALLLDVAIETVFIYQEKNPVQNILEKIETFTQWLPKGEKFTFKALEAIAYARYRAALDKSAVEPKHLLMGIMYHPTTAAARLLREQGLSLDTEDFLKEAEVVKAKKFTPESKYVLELALNATRLQQKKDIDTEQLLLGLIQLMQLGDSDLAEIFQKYGVDTDILTQKVTALQQLATAN